MLTLGRMRGLLFAALLVVGCGSGSDNAFAQSAPQGCEPGKSAACACTDGKTGAQTCKSDGSGWDSCVCGPQILDGGGDGSSPCIEVAKPPGTTCNGSAFVGDCPSSCRYFPDVNQSFWCC